MASTEPIRVLVVEDDVALSEILCEDLRGEGHVVVLASDIAEGREKLGAEEFDVALLDLTLPDGSGITLLQEVAADKLPTETIVLTGHALVSTAIEAMKLGAYDYLSKPVPLAELELAVEKAAEKARLRRENAALRSRLLLQEPVRGLITRDPAMKKLLATLKRAAPSELPVLVQGETGTGKELIARAVHENSPRSSSPFVAINCAAVPENIIESELFGHERGAFTGASERKLGLFEVAGHGVVFLDEIGDVSPGLQAKLLRALETKEFFRVGGTRVVRPDVRVVSATNKDLLEEIDSGRFREDLYYRLNGITLAIPPLRERKGDIPVLVRHFLDRMGSSKMLSPAALDMLKSYPWPGNVRELEMVVQRANLLCADETIGPESLPVEPARFRRLHGMETNLTLQEMEKAYIKAVFERHHGHRAKTARALGIDPKTLYNKLGSGKP